MEDFSKDIAALSSVPAVPAILEVVCRTTGMGFAAVARVTPDRWIACEVRDEIAFGLKPGGELPIETTICNEIRQSGQAVVIDHVAEDAGFSRHPTPAMYGFQSYISMPIMLPNGEFFGTLCAIDPRPAAVSRPEIVSMFRLFADLIAFHLDASAELARSRLHLSGERKDSELREQFIAVLGHDLRNPLASIDAGVQLLTRSGLDPKSTNILRMMKTSVGRMAGLIDNVMDFARGRLGGGLALSRVEQPVGPILEQVSGELSSSWPTRRIETRFDLPKPVVCDQSRIAQLFSNLLGNALVHGDDTQPVRVSATTRGELFELSVANGGDPIPPASFERLFHPFARGAERPEKQGLGLGLYIASEIARAHGGSLSATSSPEQTRFTFQMPLS